MCRHWTLCGEKMESSKWWHAGGRQDERAVLKDFQCMLILENGTYLQLTFMSLFHFKRNAFPNISMIIMIVISNPVGNLRYWKTLYISPPKKKKSPTYHFWYTNDGLWHYYAEQSPDFIQFEISKDVYLNECQLSHCLSQSEVTHGDIVFGPVINALAGL